MLGKKFGVQMANIVLLLTREIKFVLLLRRRTFHKFELACHYFWRILSLENKRHKN